MNLFHFGGFFLSSSFDPFTAVKRSNNSFSKEFLFFFLPPTRAELGFAGQLHQTDKVGERKKRIVRVKIERYVLLSVRLFFFCTVRAPFTINERLVDFFSFFFSSKHFLPSRCVKSEWRSNLLWKFKKKKKSFDPKPGGPAGLASGFCRPFCYSRARAYSARRETSFTCQYKRRWGLPTETS